MPRKKKTEEVAEVKLAEVEEKEEKKPAKKAAAKKTTEKTAAKTATKKKTAAKTTKKAVKKAEEPEEEEEEYLEPEETEKPVKKVVEPVVPKEKPNLDSSGKIWSIEGHLQAETEESRMDNVIRDINDSLFNKRILTGTLTGIKVVRQVVNGELVRMPCPFIMYDEKVKILFTPDSFGITKEWAERFGKGEKDAKYYRNLTTWLRGYINAPVDFVVEGWVDKESDIKTLVASRVEAMRRKKEQFLFATDPKGYYVVNRGDRLEVAVVRVQEHSIRVDCRGVECSINIRDILYGHVLKDDLKEIYSNGDRLVVRIRDIKRDPARREITDLSLSVKEEKEDPFVKWSKALSEGDMLAGTISHIDSGGYYITVCTDRHDKFVLTGSLPGATSKRPFVGSKVTAAISRIDYENEKIYAHIVNIIKL